MVAYCWCFTGVELSSTRACGDGTPSWYIRSATAPPAEGSGGPGRRRAAALRRATEADRSLCPAKLTACKIEGSVDGYEVRLSRPDRRRQGQGLTPPSSSPVHRHADRARVVRWLPARNFLP